MQIAHRLALALTLACGSLSTTVYAQAPAAAPPPTAPAQVKAPLTKGAFILYEFDVKDAQALKSVADNTRKSLIAFKGEFVMREKVQSLFGGAPTNLSVISFPGVDEARAWLASADFAKLRAERDKAAEVRAYLVEKLD